MSRRKASEKKCRTSNLNQIQNPLKTLVWQLVGAVILIFSLILMGCTALLDWRLDRMMAELNTSYLDMMMAMQNGESVALLIDLPQLRASRDYQHFRWMVILASLVVGAVAMGLVIRWLTRPLKRLTQAVGSVELDSGKTQEKVLSVPVEGPEEIQQLARAFNQTLQSISESYQRQKQFSANVAHELRTPLALLSSKIDLMETEQKQGSGGTEAGQNPDWTSLRKQIQELSTLVDRLLELTRQNPLRLSPVHPKELVEELYLDFEEMAAKAGISLVQSGDDPMLETDDTFLQRILHNLIQNAIKYNCPGGTVSVDIHEKPDEVEISVADTGVGIPEKDRDKIFNLFFRVDDSRNRATGGFGIGLTLVQTLVQQLGGRINVEDNAPQGTRMVLILPKKIEV